MGWASGLQAGLQIGNAMRQGQIRDELSEEAKKYKLTEGAYGEGLRANLENLQASRDANLASMQEQGYTPEQIASATKAYDQAQTELTRRVGLAGPDYSIAGDTSGKTYGSMAEAQQALAPMRTAGLADVYRRFGDVDKANELETRAQQQQLTGLQIQGAQRTEREQAMDEARKGEDKKWWESRLTGEDGKKRAPTSEDMLAAAQRGVASHYQTGNFDKGVASYNQYMDLAEKQIISQERERKRDGEKAFSAVMTGDLKAGMDFYNKYLPNGSIATDAKLDPKTGMITVQHTDMAGNKLPDTQISRQQLLEGISSFGDSKQALAYVQQSFMNNIHTQELGLKRESLNATKAHYGVVEKAYTRPTAATMREFQDQKTGESVLVDVTQLPQKDGVIQLPKGLVPKAAHVQMTPSDLNAAIKSLRDSRQDRHMVGGKMVPYTDAELADIVRARNISSGKATMDAADLLIEQLKLADQRNTVD